MYEFFSYIFFYAYSESVRLICQKVNYLLLIHVPVRIDLGELKVKGTCLIPSLLSFLL